MTSLQQHTRRFWLALALAIGLMILPMITVPLAGDELANWVPGTDIVFANESHGGGG